MHPKTRLLITNGDFIEVELDEEIEKQIALGRLVKYDKKAEKDDKKEDKKDEEQDKVTENKK